ncbi:hypothetical protein KC359_g72 [Hortaea werneckii]|nr:hypothetical protein KC359_g72 [Hortaea werneckii]
MCILQEASSPCWLECGALVLVSSSSTSNGAQLVKEAAPSIIHVASQIGIMSEVLFTRFHRESFPPYSQSSRVGSLDPYYRQHVRCRNGRSRKRINILEINALIAAFVDYKALKKLIKKLSATPILPPQQVSDSGHLLEESQSALQANKATFFFRLDREIEKVNTFYLQKEAELKLRLRTLLDKKRALQSRNTPATKLSSSYVTLNEGFHCILKDFEKVGQNVKGAKAHLPLVQKSYISRGLLMSSHVSTGTSLAIFLTRPLQDFTPAGQDEEVETQVLQAINAGNTVLVREWATRTLNSEESTERISRIFLNSVTTASLEAQKVLYDTGAIDYNHSDEINERNCIHEAAVGGSTGVLTAAILHGANIHAPDIP